MVAMLFAGAHELARLRPSHDVGEDARHRRFVLHGGAVPRSPRRQADPSGGATPCRHFVLYTFWCDTGRHNAALGVAALRCAVVVLS